MDRFSSSHIVETPSDTGAPTSRAWLWEGLIVVVACVIALVFRVLLLGKLSFWVDEATSVLAAKGLVQHGAPILPSGHLYRRSFAHVWVLAQTFKMLGVNEFSARLPSALFGVATIAATFYFAKMLGFKRAGFAAMFVLVFSLWAIWFSREARMYALLQLVYLLGLCFLWLGFERQSNGRNPAGFRAWDAVFLLLAAALFVAGFFTHELMALFPVVFWSYAAVAYLFTARNVGWASALKSKYGIVTMGGVLFGACVFVLAIASGKVAFSSNILGEIINKVIPEHLTRVSYFAMAKRFVRVEPFMTTMAFIGSIVLIMSKKKSGLFLLLSFWIPAIAMAVLKLERTRYMYFIYPSFVLIAVIGIIYLLTSIVGSQEFNRFLARARTSPSVLAAIALMVIVLTYAQVNGIKKQSPGTVPNSGFMVAYYPNWRLASKIDTRGKKIIVINPVPVYYYVGRVDYYTRLVRPDQLSLSDGQDENMDRYVGSRYLRTFEELKSVLEKYDCVFITRQGLPDTKQLTDEAKDYISKNLRYENQFSDSSVAVFTTRQRK